MLAHYELRTYNGDERIWTGKYRSLTNLPHWHHDCEFVIVEEGCAQISVEGQKYELFKGQCIFIGSDKIHFILAEKDSVLSFIMYDFKLTEKITETLDLVCPTVSEALDVGDVYSSLSKELKYKPPFHELKIKQLLISLVIDLFRAEKTVLKNKEVTSSTERYKKLLIEIDENFSYFTFEEAAAFMGFCPPYFSKYFRNVSGVTFTKYLNYVKIEKAVSLLKENPSILITEVAGRCGFDTIRNFNRVFKEMTGYSPKDIPKNFDILHLQAIEKEDGFNPTNEISQLLKE